MIIDIHKTPGREREVFGLFSQVENDMEESRVAPDAPGTPRHTVLREYADLNSFAREIGVAADAFARCPA